jgi:hypothetical protein
MTDLIRSNLAAETVADRLRDAERTRLGRDARQSGPRAHRVQRQRVLASMLLVPREPGDSSREA